MDKRPTAFFSYSWDGSEHEDWVINLANRLRSNGGIDATLDKFEIYNQTVNLNQMMISAIREYDYVIVVLTEDYANKANDFRGGVGFESGLLLSELRRNKDKMIFIMRHHGDYESVFPFHLRDYYAIDFSNDEQYEEKLKELIRRVYRVSPYQKAPLGEIPHFDFNKNGPTAVAKSSILADIKVPNLKKYTDLDKEEHLNASYREMKDLYAQLFDHIGSGNENFKYTLDEEGSKKCMFKLYVDGQLKTGIKMWIGGISHYSSPSINFSYGVHSGFGDGMNEMIYSEVKDEKLTLRRTMNSRGREDVTTPDKIVISVWEDHLLPALKM